MTTEQQTDKQTLGMRPVPVSTVRAILAERTGIAPGHQIVAVTKLVDGRDDGGLAVELDAVTIGFLPVGEGIEPFAGISAGDETGRGDDIRYRLTSRELYRMAVTRLDVPANMEPWVLLPDMAPAPMRRDYAIDLIREASEDTPAPALDGETPEDAAADEAAGTVASVPAADDATPDESGDVSTDDSDSDGADMSAAGLGDEPILPIFEAHHGEPDSLSLNDKLQAGNSVALDGGGRELLATIPTDFLTQPTLARDLYAYGVLLREATTRALEGKTDEARDILTRADQINETINAQSRELPNSFPEAVELHAELEGLTTDGGEASGFKATVFRANGGELEGRELHAARHPEALLQQLITEALRATGAGEWSDVAVMATRLDSESSYVASVIVIPQK